MIRIFSFYSKNGAILNRYDEVMDRLRQFADKAEKAGVVLVHENESSIYGQYSKQCAEIAAELKSEHFGLVFDPANYSIAGEDSLESESVMHPYISYVHVKDYSGKGLEMSIPGEGVSHIPQIFNRLRERDLFISMEPHLDSAGQFGGFTSPEKYKLAVNAVKQILNEQGIKWV